MLAVALTISIVGLRAGMPTTSCAGKDMNRTPATRVDSLRNERLSFNAIIVDLAIAHSISKNNFTATYAVRDVRMLFCFQVVQHEATCTFSLAKR